MLIQLTYREHNPNHPLLPTAVAPVLLLLLRFTTHLTPSSIPLSFSKVIMDIADMIIEDFLYQNVFTTYDYFCPLPKSVSFCVQKLCPKYSMLNINFVVFFLFVCLFSFYL
jgi:hypothetical protein